MLNTSSKTSTNSTPVKASVIKLAIDLHAVNAVVKVQFDDSVPKPAQTIPVPEFPNRVEKLRKQYPNAKFFSCYEAGPCGYDLHRKLTQMGVTNYVIAPVEMNGKRKTDKRDAAALGLKLAAYVAGNTDAFSVVHVPTPEQEQRRTLLRHRCRIMRKRSKAATQGRSYLLTAGIHERGAWWKPRRWAVLSATLPGWLRDLLDDLRKEAEFFQGNLKRVDGEINRLAAEENVQVPRGIGVLTAMHLSAEVLTWGRFKNRRAVSSYTGLCPGEHSSGSKRREGSIDRCGNRHVRRLLVETVWRLMMWQPDYPPLQKLRESTGSRGSKRRVVAIARRLAVDLWRINTGQSTAEKLGLACDNAPPPCKRGKASAPPPSS